MDTSTVLQQMEEDRVGNILIYSALTTIARRPGSDVSREYAEAMSRRRDTWPAESRTAT